MSERAGRLILEAEFGRRWAGWAIGAIDDYIKRGQCGPAGTIYYLHGFLKAALGESVATGRDAWVILNVTKSQLDQLREFTVAHSRINANAEKFREACDCWTSPEQLHNQSRLAHAAASQPQHLEPNPPKDSQEVIEQRKRDVARLAEEDRIEEEWRAAGCPQPPPPHIQALANDIATSQKTAPRTKARTADAGRSLFS